MTFREVYRKDLTQASGPSWDPNISTPTRRATAFSSNSGSGDTVWWSNFSDKNLPAPLDTSQPLAPGHLFIHHNITSNGRQLWIYGLSGGWKEITAELDKSLLIVHPTNSDRVLRLKTGWEPSWVTRNTFETTKARNTARHGHAVKFA